MTLYAIHGCIRNLYILVSPTCAVFDSCALHTSHWNCSKPFDLPILMSSHLLCELQFIWSDLLPFSAFFIHVYLISYLKQLTGSLTFSLSFSSYVNIKGIKRRTSTPPHPKAFRAFRLHWLYSNTVSIHKCY